MRPMPDLAWDTLQKKLSTSFPVDANTPKPVMTTRRTVRPPTPVTSVAALRFAFRHRHQVRNVLSLDHSGQAVDYLPNALHVLSDAIRNIDLEFLLESKKNVDSVQRVDSQLRKGGVRFHYAGVKMLLPGNDFDHLFLNVHFVSFFSASWDRLRLKPPF